VRIVVDYRAALRTRTGVGEYLFRTVRAMAEAAREAARPAAPGGRAVDITLFSSSWKDRPAPDDLAQLPGVHLIDRRLPVRVLNLLWHRLEWPPVELLAGGSLFDIAYSLHPLLLPASRAAQVVTIHDLDFLAHPERSSAEIRRDYPALVRKHAARAAHVVVNSHYTARQVEHELGVPAARMTVCYPGAPDWSKSLPPADDRPRRHVLFLGTLEERKNVGTLLASYGDLVARRSDLLPLILAGGARPEAATWLDEIGRPPLAGHVEYVGYVSDARRRELVESAALLVLPSYHEGFGMPVLEAMSAGVPVVVSNRGALPEVAGDAGLVVDPDDRDALAAAIERMLTDDALAAAAAAKGVARAQRFRWADTAACMLSAFERALATRA
jgi:glycosyltransferase involved in cell wall biosynthesis